MLSPICVAVGSAVGAAVQKACARNPEYQERLNRRRTAAPNRCPIVEGL